MTARGSRAIGSEHSETEVDRNRSETCSTQVDTQVSGSTCEIENRASRREPEFPDGKSTPPHVEAEGHDAVHQVVSRCNGVEHRANCAHLVVAFRKALRVPGSSGRCSGFVVGLRRRHVHSTEVTTSESRLMGRLAVFGHDGAE